MATAEQIKALLRCHLKRDDGQFFAVALQVAADEARMGHHKAAEDIKTLVKEGKANAPTGTKRTELNRLKQGELAGLLAISHPSVRLSELVANDATISRLTRIILEQRQKDKLAGFDFLPRRKILMTGPPGTGKTMSAAVLATE